MYVHGEIVKPANIGAVTSSVMILEVDSPDKDAKSAGGILVVAGVLMNAECNRRYCC